MSQCKEKHFLDEFFSVAFYRRFSFSFNLKQIFLLSSLASISFGNVDGAFSEALRTSHLPLSSDQVGFQRSEEGGRNLN